MSCLHTYEQMAMKECSVNATTKLATRYVKDDEKFNQKKVWKMLFYFL